MIEKYKDVESNASITYNVTNASNATTETMKE